MVGLGYKGMLIGLNSEWINKYVRGGCVPSLLATFLCCFIVHGSFNYFMLELSMTIY